MYSLKKTIQVFFFLERNSIVEKEKSINWLGGCELMSSRKNGILLSGDTAICYQRAKVRYRYVFSIIQNTFFFSRDK